MTSEHSKSSSISELKSILVVVFIALLIRVFVIELFFVPTGSMKSTILEGDYIFSTKYTYGYSNYSLPFAPDIIEERIFADMPKRGDIVITKSAHNMSTRFIKRVIGLPGDKVEIIDDVLYINDEKMKHQDVGTFKFENGISYIKYRDTLPGGFTYFSYKRKNLDIHYQEDFSNFGPYFVPDKHFFLLGDNRDESGDSRAQLGFVPFYYLIAKARFVLFSTKEFLWQSDLGIADQFLRIGTWLKEIRFNRTFHRLYEDQTDGNQ